MSNAGAGVDRLEAVRFWLPADEKMQLEHLACVSDDNLITCTLCRTGTHDYNIVMAGETEMHFCSACFARVRSKPFVEIVHKELFPPATIESKQDKLAEGEYFSPYPPLLLAALQIRAKPILPSSPWPTTYYRRPLWWMAPAHAKEA